MNIARPFSNTCCWLRHRLGIMAVAATATLPIAAIAQPVPGSDSGLKPTQHGVVSPQVLETDLRQTTEAVRAFEWAEGQSVRVVEDLKEAAGPTPPVEGPQPRRAMAPEVAAPVAGVNFEGIPATGVLPPDTVGDVGPNHYIQMVNSAFAIYDKAGSLLAGPTLIKSLWSQFGGPCESENDGDPIVRYDHLADRWLLSQFAVPGGAQGLHECIAISRTADPIAGGWFLYDFPTVDGATGQPVFPDYPKIGVWPDAYYMGTQRGFPNSGLDVWAFDRASMLAGAPAGLVQFSVPRPSLFLMPADLDGPPPPAGTPNFFARQVDGDRFGGGDRLEIFAFAVDWANPAASTFTQIADLPTAPFDSVLCSADLLGACVPQPGVSQRLETLTVWPMWRLQYRNFGSHEGMVVNHTVDANGQDLAGIRWYELRRAPAGSWGIFQQGTLAPDGTHRWMGSVAMDRDGNIALGYSVASGSVFPGLRQIGRLAIDPPGTLSQAETDIIVGSGAQTHPARRWGNYSSMDVDPADDCTFWYTGEYYSATSSAGWGTRVASFRYPSCGEEEPPEAELPYLYPAKVVCGLQPDPKEMKLVRGFYGSAINVYNIGDKPVRLTKELALTFPPEEESPGKVLKIAEEQLGSGEALEVDCSDLAREVFSGRLPERYIKGFVAIRSSGPLRVTGVYTAAGLDREDAIGDVRSVDVEEVSLAHRRRQAPSCPDLAIKDIGRPSVSCPGGGGTCVTTVDYTVANIGTAAAGSFSVRTVLDPAASVILDQLLSSGLGAGAEQTMTVVTPQGGNCFDPDCTVAVTADSRNEVQECNEGNNSASETTPG